MSAYWAGFNSLTDEQNNLDLSVKGQVPDWLVGTLIRNGPAQFEIDQRPLNHWFDGFAMLHRFLIGNGSIQYSNKFVASQAHQKAMQYHKLCYEEFASQPSYSRLQRLIHIFKAGLTDNTNVNVIRSGKTYVALTETTKQLVFDPVSLAVQNLWHFNDRIEGQLTTAHPQFDTDSGKLYNFVTKIGLKSYYDIYELTPGAEQRKLLCSIPVKRPAYMHSFAMTENYLIIIEPPLKLSYKKLLLNNFPFIENYDWQPTQGMRFIIIDKHTGKLVTECHTEAFFNFHVINAYEANTQELIIDLPLFSDSSIIQSLYLKQLKISSPSLGECFRFRINMQNQVIHRELFNSTKIELPTIYYANNNGKAYQYFYAASGSAEGEFFNQVAKIDIKKSAAQIWKEDNCYPGEPIFVAKPSATSEDEGIILSVVFDAKINCSFLLILDAKNFTELARAYLPHIIPFGFHGQFWQMVSH